ncbi:nascent polypeptide-associated complex subunit alpha, muscle-specific form-like [Leopardus geoffroyi]|uniref:nascent polypeptide-associated complex subunit alpha, muscle-specific form-like n=1 Tax=Leopardus geoffroyi TaxID=46844 RepID=UPI001E26509B|nr:nascent polypeptide-associated complex subunit alpha, muscle-specific form-like [Leopardus geoffroyi]
MSGSFPPSTSLAWAGGRDRRRVYNPDSLQQTCERLALISKAAAAHKACSHGRGGVPPRPCWRSHPERRDRVLRRREQTSPQPPEAGHPVPRQRAAVSAPNRTSGPQAAAPSLLGRVAGMPLRKDPAPPTAPAMAICGPKTIPEHPGLARRNPMSGKWARHPPPPTHTQQRLPVPVGRAGPSSEPQVRSGGAQGSAGHLPRITPSRFPAARQVRVLWGIQAQASWPTRGSHMGCAVVSHTGDQAVSVRLAPQGGTQGGRVGPQVWPPHPTPSTPSTCPSGRVHSAHTQPGSRSPPRRPDLRVSHSLSPRDSMQVPNGRH